jgi:predicted HTH transcriptional regulator
MAGHGEQVSLERLRQLLDQGEGIDLDFKATCDLNERSELVAITKDIAAFSTTGGHIVVGVKVDGSPSGWFTAANAKLFDEAALRSKVAPKYLPDNVSITTAVHEIDGEAVAIVFVAAHPNGFVVMQANGDYTRPSNKPGQEFRAGDVFVRRGSSSVR